MGTIKDVYDIVKDLSKSIKEITNKELANELYSKLIEIQAFVVDVTTENQELKDKIASITYELEKTRKDSLQKNIRWSVGGVGKYIDETGENYICRYCYDEYNKIYHVKFVTDSLYDCSKCGKRYYYFTNK